MKYLVPQPLPDELLSSVWMRLARHAGLPLGTVTHVLTGGRKWAPMLLTCAHIVDLAAALRRRPEDLLWRHTVFPYATAFLSQTASANALANALTAGKPAIGMGAVTQSASDNVRWRRYCPRCVRADIAQWGESYWRRSHHLPGVLTCAQHGTPLMQTSLASGTGQWSALLPQEWRVPVSRCCRPTAFDAELAQRSVAILHRPPDTGLERDGTWYRERLTSVGLLAKGRFADSELLARWAQRQLPRQPALFGLAERDCNMHWLALMVRPGVTVPFIPLKHLLFETLLALHSPAASPVTFRPSGPSASPRSDVDRRYANAVRAVVRGSIREGERVRIRDALTQAGCWTSYRHDRASFPRVQAAVRWLKQSAACCRPNWGKRDQRSGAQTGAPFNGRPAHISRAVSPTRGTSQ